MLFRQALSLLNNALYSGWEHEVALLANDAQSSAKSRVRRMFAFVIARCGSSNSELADVCKCNATAIGKAFPWIFIDRACVFLLLDLCQEETRRGVLKNKNHRAPTSLGAEIIEALIFDRASTTIATTSNSISSTTSGKEYEEFCYEYLLSGLRLMPSHLGALLQEYWIHHSERSINHSGVVIARELTSSWNSRAVEAFERLYSQ